MSEDEVLQAVKSEQGSVGAASAGELPEASKSPGKGGRKPAAKPAAKPATKANLALIPQVATEEAFCDAKLRKSAYYADENVLIFNMDVREAMAHLATAGVIVNCMVTSPPFYGQRDYGAKGQIGLEEHPQQFIEQLVACFESVRPVLAENGSLWVNLGDTYWSGKGESPQSAWEGSYTAFFDPDFSIRLTKVGADAPSHWLHFDAKYRLERQLSETLFEDPPDGEPDAGAADYEAEVARVHKLEDLFKMHTYRDGILGTRGAYVLFPGDGVGGIVSLPKPNLFVRNPAAFGGSGSHRIPSVGAFDLAPGGDAGQTQAIASLLAIALEAVAGPAGYEEERGHWAP